MILTADELLAGSSLTFEVDVPAMILNPTKPEDKSVGNLPSVRLRPLTVNDLQLISRAAREKEGLTAVLMVQKALVEPVMTITQIASLSVGLMQFLLEEVNRISGITTTEEQMEVNINDPLLKAVATLAKNFGWTPQEINQLTLGQIMLSLQMLAKEEAS
jgi:hypothetical protein